MHTGDLGSQSHPKDMLSVVDLWPNFGQRTRTHNVQIFVFNRLTVVSVSVCSLTKGINPKIGDCVFVS